MLALYLYSYYVSGIHWLESLVLVCESFGIPGASRVHPDVDRLASRKGLGLAPETKEVFLWSATC